MKDDFMILFTGLMIGLVSGMVTIIVTWAEKEKGNVYVQRAQLVDAGLAHYDRDGKFIITFKPAGDK